MLLLACSVVGYKALRFKKAITKNYATLVAKVDYLEEKLRRTTEYYEFDTAYRDDAFNWFAIGNSLTLILLFG